MLLKTAIAKMKKISDCPFSCDYMWQGCRRQMVGLAAVIATPALKGTNLRGPKNPIFGEKKIPSECSKCALSVRLGCLPYTEEFGVFCLDLFDPSKWTLVNSATAKI